MLEILCNNNYNMIYLLFCMPFSQYKESSLLLKPPTLAAFCDSSMYVSDYVCIYVRKACKCSCWMLQKYLFVIIWSMQTAWLMKQRSWPTSSEITSFCFYSVYRKIFIFLTWHGPMYKICTLCNVAWMCVHMYFVLFWSVNNRLWGQVRSTIVYNVSKFYFFLPVSVLNFSVFRMKWCVKMCTFFLSEERI